MGKGFECKHSMVDTALSACFYKLGWTIGRHPGYFIIIPLLLTLLCMSGFQRLYYNYDPEYLFSPEEGRAKAERSDLETHFPVNFTDFKASRISRPGKFGRLIVIAKDGGTMLRTHLWDQLLYLDQIVFNITVEFEGMGFSYDDLCARYSGYCYDNEVLRLSDIMPSVEAGEINVTYPIYFNPYTFETYPLPAFFGGVELTDSHTVKMVKGISLAYFLDLSEEWREDLADQWERKFIAEIEARADLFAPDLTVGKFVSSTPAWEMEASKNSITGRLCINMGAMVLFTLIASSMSDAAKSKPLLGFSGLFSACLATLAGFGFAMYIGVKFISLNMAAPFLLLGIGIDDTFVMISAWRRSKASCSVSERMARCYSDSAVSITVTSLTNFCGFIAGVITPFPCVRIFCLYTGISVAFIYVWHITLFGGFLTLAAYAEASNRHGLFCFKVTPKSLSKNHNWFYRQFCTGGINPNDPLNPVDNQEHWGMVFCRDHLGNLLNRTWFKCVVLLVFGVYIVVASWGVTMIKEGLEKRHMANYDSYSVEYYDIEERYFKDFSFTINVVVTGDIDFSDPSTQNHVENVLQALENSTYIDATFTVSWLRDFLDFVKRNAGYEDVQLLVSNEVEFIHTLRTVYLTDPFSPLRLDIEFNDDYTRIKGSRFLIQARDVKDSYTEQKMVEELRAICDRFSDDRLQVNVFHPFFIYIDQYLSIVPQTIQCIAGTAVVIMIISFIMIPSAICSMWVAFSIVSIEIGVLGYMAWWDVNLDGVALINLIMCIGFSVDFSAHICYHYVTEHDQPPNHRIRASLYALGLPILQGGLSTILGVIGLAFAPCYMYVTFFKMVFLVILLGTFHGMVLLPVLLSLFGPGSCATQSSTKSSRSSGSGVSTPRTISCHINPSIVTINLDYSYDFPGTPGTYTSSSSNSTPRHFEYVQNSGSPGTRKPLRVPRHHHHHHHRRHKSYDLAEVTTTVDFHSPDVHTSTPKAPLKLEPVFEGSEFHARIPPFKGSRSSRVSPPQQMRGHPRDAPQQMRGHQRIHRTCSHHPGLRDSREKTMSVVGAKPPLRKYHSFPYQPFNNDLGYSSEE